MLEVVKTHEDIVVQERRSNKSTHLNYNMMGRKNCNQDHQWQYMRHTFLNPYHLHTSKLEEWTREYT